MAHQMTYTNNFSNEIIHKFVMSKPPDVQFILEKDGEAVKIPAHKELLSISSPVFKAMFTGDLKENGDVKIVDASAAAFEEFLQFFYSNQVKLTMDNIEHVLNLVHKYDILAGARIAVDFLRENLTSDQILWGLYLAMKYRLEDLMAHCKNQIRNDSLKVLDVLKLESSDGDADGYEAVLSTKNQMISKTDLSGILPTVLMVAKDVIFNQSAELMRLQPKLIYPVVFSDRSVYEHVTISSVEKIQFAISTGMWLSEIILAEVYQKIILDEWVWEWDVPQWKTISIKGTISVAQEEPRRVLFRTSFGMNANASHCKLAEPIFIHGRRLHSIEIQSENIAHPSKMAIAKLTYLAKGIELELWDPPKYTLIDRLHFFK